MEGFTELALDLIQLAFIKVIREQDVFTDYLFLDASSHDGLPENCYTIFKSSSARLKKSRAGLPS
jgi:hypothetical protein